MKPALIVLNSDIQFTQTDLFTPFFDALERPDFYEHLLDYCTEKFPRFFSARERMMGSISAKHNRATHRFFLEALLSEEFWKFLEARIGTNAATQFEEEFRITLQLPDGMQALLTKLLRSDSPNQVVFMVKETRERPYGALFSKEELLFRTFLQILISDPFDPVEPSSKAFDKAQFYNSNTSYDEILNSMRRYSVLTPENTLGLNDNNRMIIVYRHTLPEPVLEKYTTVQVGLGVDTLQIVQAAQLLLEASFGQASVWTFEKPDTPISDHTNQSTLRYTPRAVSRYFSKFEQDVKSGDQMMLSEADRLASQHETEQQRILAVYQKASALNQEAEQAEYAAEMLYIDYYSAGIKRDGAQGRIRAKNNLKQPVPVAFIEAVHQAEAEETLAHQAFREADARAKDLRKMADAEKMHADQTEQERAQLLQPAEQNMVEPSREDYEAAQLAGQLLRRMALEDAANSAGSSSTRVTASAPAYTDSFSDQGSHSVQPAPSAPPKSLMPSDSSEKGFLDRHWEADQNVSVVGGNNSWFNLFSSNKGKEGAEHDSVSAKTSTPLFSGWRTTVSNSKPKPSAVSQTSGKEKERCDFLNKQTGKTWEFDRKENIYLCTEVFQDYTSAGAAFDNMPFPDKNFASLFMDREDSLKYHISISAEKMDAFVQNNPEVLKSKDRCSMM